MLANWAHVLACLPSPPNILLVYVLAPTRPYALCPFLGAASICGRLRGTPLGNGTLRFDVIPRKYKKQSFSKNRSTSQTLPPGPSFTKHEDRDPPIQLYWKSLSPTRSNLCSHLK